MADPDGVDDATALFLERRWEESWGVGGVFRRAWGIFNEHRAVFVGAAAVQLAASFAIHGAGLWLRPVVTELGEDAALGVILRVVVELLDRLARYAFEVGMVRMAIAAVRGEAVPLGLLFSGRPWLVRTWGGHALMGLLVVASLPLLGLPLLVWIPGFALWRYLLVDEDLGPIDALRGAWALSKGSRYELMMVALGTVLASLGGILALGVGVLVSLPVCALAWALVYENMGIHGPRSPG